MEDIARDLQTVQNEIEEVTTAITHAVEQQQKFREVALAANDEAKRLGALSEAARYEKQEDNLRRKKEQLRSEEELLRRKEVLLLEQGLLQLQRQQQGVEVPSAIKQAVYQQEPSLEFISISQVRSEVAHEVLSQLGVSVDDGNLLEPLEESMAALPNFSMADYANEAEATPFVLDYIEKCLKKHDVNFGCGGFQMLDVHTNNALYRLQIQEKMFRGGVDGVILPYASLSVTQQLRCAIEVKHSEKQKALYKQTKFRQEVPATAAPTTFKGTVQGQALLETIAACTYAEYPELMLLLTDVEFNTLIRYQSGVITLWRDVSFGKAINKLAVFLRNCSTKRAYKFKDELAEMSAQDIASLEPTQQLRKKLRPSSDLLSEQVAAVLHPDMDADEKLQTALELIQAHKPFDADCSNWRSMFG